MRTRQVVSIKSKPKKFKQSDLEDIQAVESCKKGQSKAFAHIVHKYQPILLGRITSAIHDEDEAKDIVQDIFIKVYSNISKYQQSFTFNAWLTRFAQNFLIDVIREKKRSPLYNNTISIDEPMMHSRQSQYNVDSIKKLEIKDESTFGYEESNEKKIQDDFEKINKIMGKRLSSLDQNILKLYYLGNKKQREISKLLKVNTNTVRVKLHRMRNKLERIGRRTTMKLQ